MDYLGIELAEYTMEYYTLFKRNDINSLGTYLIEKSSYNRACTV